MMMSQDEIAKKIFNFLKENKDRDHSVSEIAEALGLKRGITGNIVRALTISKEVVITRTVSKAVMYQYREA
jgi:DNA-binding Lrp family transcriptional regulator